MPDPIGILGGTFDPIHNGHLRLVLECQEILRLREIRLIPVHTPPHRRPPVAGAPKRLRMVQIAAENLPSVEPDDREIRRGGTSYTVDTLRSLRDEYDDRPICLILGMDAFRLLYTWRQWTSLLDFVHIIVADRPGRAVEIGQAEVARLFAERLALSLDDLRNSAAGRVFKVDVPLLEISATHIRALVAAGRNARFLLPDKVIEFIGKEKLYRNGR